MIDESVSAETPGSTVSVVMATYDRATVLPRAIDSALAQLRARDELIIVDDGSRDDTSRVLASYGDRLRSVRQDNRGASAARNRGLDLARGDYVAFLDDDDAYLPHRLEVMRTVLDRRPEVCYSFTNYTEISRDGRGTPSAMQSLGPHFDAWAERQTDLQFYSSIAELPDGLADFRVIVGDDYLVQMKMDYVITGILMVRRGMAGAHLRFFEELATYEDWDLTSRLSRLAPVAYLETDLYAHHTPPAHRLMDGNDLAHSTARLTVLERVWGRDAEFLREHEATFRARCDVEHLWRARRFVTHGQPRRAREELARLSAPVPRTLQMLAALPAPLLSALMKSRRAVKRAIGTGA